MPDSNGADIKVGIIMGSQSDWPTMKEAATILDELGIAYEAKIVSAHRTPDRLWSYGKSAADRGLQVIIAGAGGAAHLPGMVASKTRVPVVGVPVQTRALSGVDSLYSIVQMPKGFPVATMAIGAAGAANAGLMAAGILALQDPALAQRLDDWRDALSASIPEEPSDDCRAGPRCDHRHPRRRPAGADALGCGLPPRLQDPYL
jgi:5-(carboxyamino)imidazole ribonucleotide mutase